MKDKSAPLERVFQTVSVCYRQYQGDAAIVRIMKMRKTFFKHFFVYLYLRDRERERDRQTDRTQVQEGQREKETQNPKQAPGSELSTQSLTRGLNPRTARS